MPKAWCPRPVELAEPGYPFVLTPARSPCPPLTSPLPWLHSWEPFHTHTPTHGHTKALRTRPALHSLLSANTKPYILVWDKSLFNCLKEETH